MTERVEPGKYLDDETLDRLIEDWGHDLSLRANTSIVNIGSPREDREQNRQRMIDTATVYAGLKMLKEERRDVRMFYSDTFGSGMPDGFSEQ